MVILVSACIFTSCNSLPNKNDSVSKDSKSTVQSQMESTKENNNIEVENSIPNIPPKEQKYEKKIILENPNPRSQGLSGNIIYSDNHWIIHTYEYYDDYENNDIKKETHILVDSNGNVVYDGVKNDCNLRSFYDNTLIVQSSDYKEFYKINIKTNQKEQIDNNYFYPEYKGEYIQVVDKNRKIGLIDNNGNVVVPCMYDYISEFDQKGLAIVSQNSKYGAIDKNNNIVIPLKYALIRPFDEGNRDLTVSRYLWDNEKNSCDYTLASTLDGKIITIDRKGNEVFNISDNYEPTKFLKTGCKNLYPVKKDSICGFINLKGQEVIPFMYDEISSDFVNGYAIVMSNANSRRESAVIDMNNKMIIPYVYTEISSFDQKGFAIARTEGEGNKIIDLANNVVYEATGHLEQFGQGVFTEKIDNAITILMFNKVS